MLKLKEFMIQSPSGATHAINPKTNKTYCGYPKKLASFVCHEHALEDLGWRFLDVLPSDKHEPSCKICVRHYDEPLREELTKIANDLKECINDFLCTRIILKDVKAIGRFTENIAKFMRSEAEMAKEKVKVEAKT